MKKVLVATAILASGMFSWGIAQGASGPNPSSSSTPPGAVAGSAAGMPPTAQVRWAVINADASKARTFPGNVTSAADPSFPGGYIVTFPNDVSKCAYVVSTGQTSSNGVESGYASAQGASTNAKAVYVYTRNADGTPAPHSFHLSVEC